MLEAENRTLRLIANGLSLRETIQHLCREVEDILPNVVCAVASIDSCELLHWPAADTLPTEFRHAIESMAVKLDSGSRGLATAHVPVHVLDIAENPTWNLLGGPSCHAGIQACWSAPIAGKDGETVGILALFLREQRAPLEQERAIIAACVDLCEIAFRRHRQALDRERRANVDALTGLPNRGAFNAALAGLGCDVPGSWALFVIDLDNLKAVNDTFGHQAGDGLIRAAGERIARVMSPDVTFRLGGDEFAVIVRRPAALIDLDSTAAMIFDALERPADCDGHSVVPGATIGGAALSASDADALTVYQNADFALYHAKETGRGGFVRYWPGIGTRITHRRDAVRDVSAALQDDRIDAYYQPVVRLDTGKIVGVEALCRLRNEGGEIVAAQAFHEAMADAHVASELTGLMLSIVARDVRSWLDAGIPVGQVGVNVSVADFCTGDLIGKVKQSFGGADVPLDHLILEVNEDVSLSRCAAIVGRKIKLLRESGVQVALDDFGTAHGSLTHLLDVPVDAIKIDRSFIARLWPEDPSIAIVEGLIDIARRLDIRVIAEGIETEVQASQLWMMGCKLGQGFAFATALDRNATKGLLLKHAEAISSTIPIYPQPQRTRARPKLLVSRAAG